MKRLPIWILILAMVVALAGCDLVFTKTVEYNISGSSYPLNIRYQNSEGEISDLTVSSPWSTNFELGVSKRPFVAFIRVDNNGSGTVTVQILEDDLLKTTGTVSAGGIQDFCTIIE
jgi:hypothetical protein